MGKGSGLFLHERMELSNVLLLTKAGLRATVPTLCSPGRTEGKNSGTVHHRPDNPTDAVQENGTYGGRRQSRWLRTADGFAV
jgi:hypothetical protein